MNEIATYSSYDVNFARTRCKLTAARLLLEWQGCLRETGGMRKSIRAIGAVGAVAGILLLTACGPGRVDGGRTGRARGSDLEVEKPPAATPVNPETRRLS